MPNETALEIDAASIDALAERSGDTSIWHTQPGAAHRESALLGARMDGAQVDPQARLAHGLSGIILALRTAYQQHPDAPISGMANIRYAAPVFEGATLSAQVETQAGGTGGFVVTTDQLQPDLAITGRLLYGVMGEAHDPSFYSLAQQQLYSLEEAAGMISALLGLGVEEDGRRVLLIVQHLELLGVITVGDILEAAAEITDRRPSGAGERVTARIGIVRTNADGQLVAWGDATFLVMEPSETQ